MSDENPFLQVIRVWAGLAWADGVISDQERSAMTRLVDQAGLPDADRATAMTFLDSQPELDLDGLKGGSVVMREGIYQAACRLAKVDKDVAAEERAFLVRLRKGLDLDDAAADAIEKKVKLPE